jgi:hypothetical protein
VPLAVLERFAEEPDEPLCSANLGARVASPGPGKGSSSERDAIAVVLGDYRHVPVTAPPYEPDRARRLAMNDVEGSLAVEAHERLARTRKPRRISPRQPRMVVGGVDVVPARAVSFLSENALRVASRHDVDLMPSIYQALGERSRMVLHPADAVARTGDFQKPHGALFYASDRAALMVAPRQIPVGSVVVY